MRGVVGRSAAATVVAAVIAATVAPAYAADGVGLSFDGRHWSSSLSRPLFPAAFRWVPGDVQTRSFWIKDQGPTGARVSIAVTTADADRLLADRDITLRARVAGGSWVTLHNGDADERLSDEALRRGARRRVDVRVSFDPASHNHSQRSQLPLRFVVTLTDAAVHDSPAVKTGSSGGGSSILPSTGSTVTAGLLWLAAILIGSGTSLLLLGRRRRVEDEARVEG